MKLHHKHASLAGGNVKRAPVSFDVAGMRFRVDGGTDEEKVEAVKRLVVGGVIALYALAEFSAALERELPPSKPDPAPKPPRSCQARGPAHGGQCWLEDDHRGDHSYDECCPGGPREAWSTRRRS